MQKQTPKIKIIKSSKMQSSSKMQLTIHLKNIYPSSTSNTDLILTLFNRLRIRQVVNKNSNEFKKRPFTASFRLILFDTCCRFQVDCSQVSCWLTWPTCQPTQLTCQLSCWSLSSSLTRQLPLTGHPPLTPLTWPTHQLTHWLTQLTHHLPLFLFLRKQQLLATSTSSILLSSIWEGGIL